jgi:hypothetical protein
MTGLLPASPALDRRPGAVVGGAVVRVAKGLVGDRDRSEAFCGRRFVGMSVRVRCACGAPVGTRDLGVRRIALDAEHSVKVTVLPTHLSVQLHRPVGRLRFCSLPIPLFAGSFGYWLIVFCDPEPIVIFFGRCSAGLGTCSSRTPSL